MYRRRLADPKQQSLEGKKIQKYFTDDTVAEKDLMLFMVTDSCD